MRAGSALRTLAGLAICAVLSGRASALEGAPLAASSDLRAEAALAAVRGTPLVVLFSLPDCRYCAVVRRNYLMPLTRMPREADRFVVRELELTGAAPLAGFHGEATSGTELARRYGLRVAPTIVLLDRDGELLAPPLVGGDVSGMYGAYLDQALDEARNRLASRSSARAAVPRH